LIILLDGMATLLSDGLLYHSANRSAMPSFPSY
jgi:hypothetical protein